MKRRRKGVDPFIKLMVTVLGLMALCLVGMLLHARHIDRAQYATFVRLSGRPDVTFDEWWRLSLVERAALIRNAEGE